MGQEFILKFIVVGELGVGKTSVVRRYVNNTFTANMKGTLGVDFALKVLNIDNSTVQLQLWDIAGQERFGPLTRVYYKSAVGALVVYDVSREHTFHEVIKWKKDIDKKVQIDGRPIPCILLANKCDTLHSPLSKEEMTRFCEENDFLTWFETSAKKNMGIEDACQYLFEFVLKNDLKPAKEEANVLRVTDQDNTRAMDEKDMCLC